MTTDATGEVKLWDLDGPNLGRSLRSFRCDPRAAHVLLLPNVYQVITSHPDGGMFIYNMTPIADASASKSSEDHRSSSQLPSATTFAAIYSELQGGNKNSGGSAKKKKNKNKKKNKRNTSRTGQARGGKVKTGGLVNWKDWKA